MNVIHKDKAGENYSKRAEWENVFNGNPSISLPIWIILFFLFNFTSFTDVSVENNDAAHKHTLQAA